MAELKRLDLLLKEVQDPVAQDNFWRLKFYLDNLTEAVNNGTAVPTVTQVPKLIETFNTDIATQAGNLVRVNGVDSVTRVTNNFKSVIPNGIFGIGFNKPSATRIEVLFVGIMGGYTGFTPGLPLFISITGTPTHTPPSTSVVQQIGFAVKSTELFLHLMVATQRATGP